MSDLVGRWDVLIVLGLFLVLRYVVKKKDTKAFGGTRLLGSAC